MRDRREGAPAQNSIPRLQNLFEREVFIADQTSHVAVELTRKPSTHRPEITYPRTQPTFHQNVMPLGLPCRAAGQLHNDISE